MEQKNSGSKIAVSIVLAVAIFYIGTYVGKGSVKPALGINLENKETDKPLVVDFSPFWKAWNILQEKYVPASSTQPAVNDQDKVWGAISGLAGSYEDPYTVFLPPTQNEIFEADVRGNFGGVGMEIGIQEGVLTVIAPLKNTPAYRAGVKAGDKIVQIGERSTYNLTTEESVSLIRGEAGTAIEITVIREGQSEPLKFNLVRETINIPTINSALRSDKVFVIELYNFSADSPNLFRRALREFINSRTDKLLLDLRGNPGGYLEASVDMASWFLPAGKAVVREDFGGKREEIVHRSRGYDIFTDKLKMVILVDNGSASASEILAGALQEHSRAKIVGSKTFGKGSVQELVKITPETSLKVSIARWLTPNGVSISAGGITPDIEIKNTKDELEKGVDIQKQKAIETLLNWGK